MDQPGAFGHRCNLCQYKCKQAGTLKQHKATAHDIGDHECGYCCRNRNSRNAHEDMNSGTVHICRECYHKATGKRSRIEKEWSDYLDEHFGTEHLLGSDRSMRGMGGCQLYRPDKLYASPGLVLICECDEKQHLYSAGDYTCDERRISDLFDEFGGSQVVVVRWNPDSYAVAQGVRRATKRERMQRMLEVMQQVLVSPPQEMLKIYYLYFDFDNPRLSQHIPHTMVSV